VDKLERALLEEQGVTSVEVTLEPGRAVVRGSIDRERLRRVVEGLGFEVAEA
jgi:copper chaperone CopZ